MIAENFHRKYSAHKLKTKASFNKTVLHLLKHPVINII